MRHRLTSFVIFVVLCAGIALAPIACSSDSNDNVDSGRGDTATSMTPG